MNVYILYDTYEYFHEDVLHPIILKGKEGEIKAYITHNGPIIKK